MSALAPPDTPIDIRSTAPKNLAMEDWVYFTAHPDQQVKIDREDLERVNQHAWRITKGTTGRPRVVTSVRGPKGSRQLTLGKFLMDPPPGKLVYPRRFNDGLDYRKGNLIVCTLAERQRLLPKNRKKTTSEYRGVSYSKADSRWKAGIELDGVSINLGHFESEVEAAHAYNEAARKHFGEMAYQNNTARQKTTDRRET